MHSFLSSTSIELVWKQETMARSVIFVTFIACVAAAVLPDAAQEKAAPYCNTELCISPECRCSSTDIPGGLSVSETPQVCIIFSLFDIRKRYDTQQVGKF